MNGEAIGKLVWKDWYLNRLAIGLMLGGTILGTILLSVPGKTTFSIGVSLVLSMFIALIFYLPLTTVLEERTKKTLPFIMSLPVSPAEYAAAKLSANLLLFLVPWSAGGLGAVLLASRVTDGSGAQVSHLLSTGFLPAFMGGIVVLFAFILSFAIMTESMGWTIGLIVGSMFLFGNVVTQIFPRIPGASAYLSEIGARGPALFWTLGVEVLAVALLLVATFSLQVRKRDFL